MNNMLFLKKVPGVSLVILLTLGITSFPIFAQEPSKPDKVDKKEKTVTVKIKTGDKGEEIIEIDTLLVTDSLKKFNFYNLSKEFDLQEIENSLRDLEVMLDVEKDSLDSLVRHFHAKIVIDGKDCPHLKDFKDMDIDWYGFDDEEEEGDGPEGVFEDVHSFKGPGNFFQPPDSPGQGSWTDGYSPWGKISEIKVKDRRHGKKIVIRTQDPDFFQFHMVPPVPPMPPGLPKTPKKVRKVIIEK